MIKYKYIRNNREMKDFRNYLSSGQIEMIAMDFEGEFSLHQYGEALCLIQIYDGKNYFIIDPINIDSNEIRNLMENKKIVKIFYDAQSDKALVFKIYDIEIRSVLDLIDMIHVLEGQARGLDAMILKYLDIAVGPKKKFQKHNWTLRPVKEEAIQYALGDVRFLFQLKDELLKRITENGLVEKYVIRLALKEHQVRINPIPGVKRKPDYKKLHKKQKRVFDALYDIRDRHAKELNWPPNNVISNIHLFKIAKGTESIENSINGKVPGKLKDRILKEVSSSSALNGTE